MALVDLTKEIVEEVVMEEGASITLSEFTMNLIMEDRIEEAEEIFLAESIENDILQRIQETGGLDYLMKMEKFFDDRDLYLFHGWEEAQVVSAPKVEKFWVSIDLRLAPDAEIKAALRCCSDQEAQNTVKYKKLEDGSFFLRFKILRRVLDQVEMDSKDRAEEIAQKESEV